MPKKKGRKSKAQVKKEKANKGKKNEKSNKKNNQHEDTSIEGILKKYNVRLGPEGYIAAPPATPKSVTIHDFSMMDPAGGRFLLNKTELKITEGHKYGLVGLNGSGKTTLLRLIAKYDIEKFPRHIRILHVKQEQKVDDRPVMEAVLTADELRTQLGTEEERITLLLEETDDETEQDQLQTILDHIWDVQSGLNFNQSEALASKILTGLGFTSKMQAGKCSDLSGGWRMRVALAKALYVEPDLLLLDEPTNHLDFPTVLWLQDYLCMYEKTVVLVSHDRTFLNKVCKHMVLLKDEKLTYYKGNYNMMEKIRKEELAHKQSVKDAWDLDVRTIKEFIAQFKDKGAKRQAQVQSKVKILEKLEADPPPEIKEDKPLTFAFPEIGKIPQPVCRFENITFSWNPKTDARPLLDNINFQLDMDSRVGMLGANGVGKTTLVKLILGEIEPLDVQVKVGEDPDADDKEDEEDDSSSEDEPLIWRNQQTRIALFTQHHTDQLDLTMTPIEYLLHRFKDDEELADNKGRYQYVRARLGRYHITGIQQETKMQLLSGGQKSRVAFCVCTWVKPHFIIMDEPTNHLDIQIIDSLIEAVKDFVGGVLIISHDQHFLKQVANQFWAVTPEGINMYRHFENAKKFALKTRLEQIKKG